MPGKVKVTQSRLSLCNLMDYTVHGILQGRILECLAFRFSRGSSQPRDQTQISLIAGGFFYQLSHKGRSKESEVAQSCLTLCDPMVCSLPGSSVHGILQARVLEWVAISFSGGSSQPRDQTLIAGRHFNL